VKGDTLVRQTKAGRADSVVEFWRMLELFSPQPIPKRRDPGVSEWTPGKRLPWESRPDDDRDLVQHHVVYLGPYPLAGIYDWLHQAFSDAQDAFDSRPPGESACAALVVDERGSLVPGSPTLSSALWAVGRIRAGDDRPSEWVEAFSPAAEQFTERVTDLVGEDEDDGTTPIIGATAMRELLEAAHASAGVTALSRLAGQDVRIRTVPVKRAAPDQTVDSDFLNSFFLGDLTVVRNAVDAGDVGAALRSYLTPDGAVDEESRHDVAADVQAENDLLGPSKIPLGRWPASATHHLARSQQFAVNHLFDALGDTGGTRGVNGPPGTGKTTTLRDVLAGNVVERARTLSRLPDPNAAFSPTTHRWTADQYSMSVPALIPSLTGYEMVVTSANNAAVENVSEELPSSDALGEEFGDAEYFADIATSLLDKRKAPDKDPQAWGLVAAKLGNKKNRGRFHSAFWFGARDGSRPGLQDILKAVKNGEREPADWARAREEFKAAEGLVQRLLEERAAAARRIADLESTTASLRSLRDQEERSLHQLRRARTAVAERQAVLEAAQRRQSEVQQRLYSIIALRPGWVEALLTLGRAPREWRSQVTPVMTEQTQRRREVGFADVEYASAQHTATVSDEQLGAVRTAMADTQTTADSLASLCSEDRTRYGDAYPLDDTSVDRFHTRAPWLDPELDRARSMLFLQALRLHRAWLENTVDKTLPGLRAAVSVVAGSAPAGLSPEAAKAAWQLFFMVVPMVSTTFASISRMFGALGSEALGWLLIDEAGQACPQYAVGAIWRARRVLAVGDPLQLTPVVTMPAKAQRDIATAFGLTSLWIPPAASVQTLADRVSPFGTTLAVGDDDKWVAAPLRVHRRCDDPMFSLCNRIAYGGLMVSAVHRSLKGPSGPDRFDGTAGPIIASSYWADTPAETPGSHLQEREFERLGLAMEYLQTHGVDAHEVIAVSPFRAVANRLESFSRDYPGMRGGTVHTAQGREAEVVFLVLGGDPDAPGAKAWASESVNLVNVAVSRAKRRLYVIGDRTAWAEFPFFRDLAASLG